MRMRIATVGVVVVLSTTSAPAQPPEVDSGSSFRSEVRRLVAVPPLSRFATRAIALHNDVEVWVNRQLTGIIGAASCDEQRDFVAAIWLRWNEMGVGRGAGVTIKSYTGRVIASAEEGFTGPRFHC